MTAVMAFGTFDLFHPGHRYYLREAKKLGDRLVVVVARDSTVRRVKRLRTTENEEERLRGVRRSKLAHEVILGGERDPFAVVRSVRPSVIALGYDQKHFTRGLKQKLERAKIRARIVRIAPYKPQKYKSSFKRQALRRRQRNRVGSPTAARGARASSRRTP